MELGIIGVAVALNFIIVKMKFTRKRWEDATFDILTLTLLMAVFSGSYAGLVVSSIASLLISLYLFVSPPNFFGKKTGVLAGFINELKKF